MSRGRPSKITPERYPELLDLLRSGKRMPAVAAAMGVSKTALYSLTYRNEEMAAAMRAARDEAKRARHEPSESCYVNNQCREDECTAEATAARLRRRARAASAPVAELPAPPRVSVYELLADEEPPLADSA